MQSIDIRDPRPGRFTIKKRPKQARAVATFDAVVEAAARILGQEGYAALTTDRLATVAGVGIGSVYEYFADKDSIIAEVVRRALDALTRDLSGCAAAAALAASPEAWLRSCLGAMLAAVRKRRDLLRTLHCQVAFLDEIEEVRQFPARMVALVAGSPCVLGALPQISRAQLFLVTVMIRSAVLEAVFDPPPDVPDQEVEDTLVHMVMTLLASSASAAGVPSAGEVSDGGCGSST